MGKKYCSRWADIHKAFVKVSYGKKCNRLLGFVSVSGTDWVESLSIC